MDTTVDKLRSFFEELKSLSWRYSRGKRYYYKQSKDVLDFALLLARHPCDNTSNLTDYTTIYASWEDIDFPSRSLFLEKESLFEYISYPNGFPIAHVYPDQSVRCSEAWDQFLINRESKRTRESNRYKLMTDSFRKWNGPGSPKKDAHYYSSIIEKCRREAGIKEAIFNVGRLQVPSDESHHLDAEAIFGPVWKQSRPEMGWYISPELTLFVSEFFAHSFRVPAESKKKQLGAEGCIAFYKSYALGEFKNSSSDISDIKTTNIVARI